MKNSEAIKRIQKAGYKFTALMNGGYMAVKGFATYKSDTVTGLYHQIF